jgi:hypothetical protein
LIIEDPSWWKIQLIEAGIEILSEEIVRYTSKQRKKGSPIAVVKYNVVTR